MYNNVHHFQPEQSNPSSAEAEDFDQELFLLDVFEAPSQWNNTAPYQLNLAPSPSPTYSSVSSDFSGPLSVATSHPSTVTAPMPIPVFIPSPSAPPSPNYFHPPLRSYSSLSSVAPAVSYLTPPRPSPQLVRSGSLPDASALHSATPMLHMPASYPAPFYLSSIAMPSNHHVQMETFYPPVNPNSAVSAPYVSRPSQVESPRPRRERVPQTLEMTSSNRYYSVDFTVNGEPGVRVEDAINELVELDAGRDRPFTSNGSRQIRLVIKWPGYPELGMYVPVKEMSPTRGGFVTKKHFASLLGERIRRFVTKMSKTEIKEDCKKWKLGNEPGSIKLGDLWLVSLARASRNVWMAELEVQRS